MNEDDRFDAYIEKARDNIRRVGRTVIGVIPTTDSPLAFSYTVGNTAKHLPEFLILGLIRGTEHVFNALSDKMIERGRPFEDREIVDIGAKCPVMLVDCDDGVKDEFTLQVGNFFDGDYAVMQVVVPDPEGRWPWDPECEEPYRSFPLRAERGMQ